MMPSADAPKTEKDHEAGYGVINEALEAVPLQEGRACLGGECCEACSRVWMPSFATHRESAAFLEELQFAIVPPLHQFSLQKCAFRDMRTTLIFVRFVERMRRSIAHEYGLPLSGVLPLQTFVSCFIGAQDKQGGLHSDESTHSEFHYSCVMYLSTQHQVRVLDASQSCLATYVGRCQLAAWLCGPVHLTPLLCSFACRASVSCFQDFEGGTFQWSDPPTAESNGARVITPQSPTQGAAVIFSSGCESRIEEAGTTQISSLSIIIPVLDHVPRSTLTRTHCRVYRTAGENMHEVEPLADGTRFAIPSFFTTCQPDEPVPPPADDAAAADELHRTLLTPENVADFRQFMVQWHTLLAPGHQ